LVEENAVTVWLRWFAQPWALWLLLALPAVSVLLAWAAWRRRRALRQLGTAFLVDRLALIRPRARRWQAMTLSLGLFGLIVGIAGPRWGADAQPELLSGKDIVVVLDLSKSMLAEQPNRLERARRSLRDFADMLEARGGHRVALVVFAAHAKLQFPLTGDYDHFRFAVEQADAEILPPALRAQSGEKAVSGTRLGEALRLAAAAHDPKRPGWQDIVLLSDGDDPASDDEWVAGVQEAHKLGIPIHVVAVGDPRESHPIRLGNDVLRYGGVPVATKLNEPLLQEITRRTSGIYFPAHQSALSLGKLMRGYLETRPDLAESLAPQDDVRLLRADPRCVWFLLPAFFLLSLTMLWGDGTPQTANLYGELNLDSQPEADRKNRRGSLARVAVIALLPLLISAEPPSSVEDAMRQGNAAFARQQFEDALTWYAKSESITDDPGLVAFNQGAALFRLGRFDEAAAHYQRCLEDQAIPAARLARANYDYGTALLQADAKDRRRLEQAIAAFRRCLDSQPEADLRTDAIANLELAKLLWLQAKPYPNVEPPNGADEFPERPSSIDPRGGNDPTKALGNTPGMADEGGPDKNGVDHPGLSNSKKKLAHGPLQVLPDSDKLTPLTPDETTAHLEQIVDRLRRERRSYWQQAAPTPAQVKDW
jgi:Ca-activated chloride channel homolog